MPEKRARVRSGIRWSLIAAGLASIGFYAFSVLGGCEWRAGPGTKGACLQRVYVGSGLISPGWHIGPHAPSSYPRGWMIWFHSYGWKWWPAWFASGTYRELSVPLWIPTVGISVPAAIVAWRGRRRRGVCRGCGYSLQGNATGVCPECGRSVADDLGLQPE